jgi:uncharacterized protein YbaP (TraB family)
MHRKLLTIAFLLFTSITFAQNTILWKVTKAESSKVSYLLGTYHFFGNSFVDSLPVIREKLNACDLVVTEVKIDRARTIAYYNSRPSSTELSAALSEDDFNYIATLFKNSGVDITKFSPGELFVRLSAAYPKFKCSVINANDKLIMDEYIQQLGNEQHKTEYYFETDSFQLEKMYEATKVYDWKFFKKSMPPLLAQYRSKTPDKALCAFPEQYASFTVDYRFKDECQQFNGSDVLIKNRNEDWMQKLPALLEKNNCFIAVGLAHLYFKCGLIEKLRALGYTVEPVAMK